MVSHVQRNQFYYKSILMLSLVIGLCSPMLFAGKAQAYPPAQDTLPTLVYGQTVNGRIDDSQPSMFFSFDAAQEDVITIAMVVTAGDLDPFIVLNTPDRIPMATDDNSGGGLNARLTFVIPTSGRYIIQATHAGGVPPVGGGDFSLNLTAAVDDGVPPGATEPSTPETTTTTPQDSSTRLVKLIPGATITGTLSRQTALHFYWFDALQGDLITLTPQNTSAFQPLIVLYDAGFDETARAEAGEPLRTTIPQSGIYFAAASLPDPASPGGDYGFSVDYLPNPATSENFIDIIYGENQGGNLNDTLPAVTYRFRGSAGDTITIVMNRTGGDLNSYLYLLDSAGELLFEDNDSGGENGNARITYTLPADGVYVIVASRLGQTQGTTSGSYLLDLQSDTAAPIVEDTPVPVLPSEYANLPEIAYGETVEGEISNAQFVDFYVFTGQAGDAITIEMISPTIEESPQGLDPLLILLDSARIPLAENDDIEEGVIRNARITFTLPQTDYYAIVATRFEQDAGTTSGPYTLTLSGPGAEATTTSTDPTATLLERLSPPALNPGTPQQDTLDSGAALYTFNATADDTIDLTVTADEGIDTILVLANENLSEVASSGTGSLTGITIPKTGPYLVMVAPRFGPASPPAGGYILALTQGGETPAITPENQGPQALTYGDTVTGVIDDSAVSRIYTFTGSADNRIQITMEATAGSQLDSYLELRDANGEVVDANDDINPGIIRDSRIVTVLPVTGTYTIIASRYVGPDAPVTSGNYRLTLELLAENVVIGISPDTVPMRYGQTEVGEINDNQYVWFFVFDGTAGDIVTIEVDHLSGNLDSVMHLYRSEGDSWVEMASNDDSPTGGTYAPLLSDITLPQTGKYLVAVSRYGMEREATSGTFAITITNTP